MADLESGGNLPDVKFANPVTFDSDDAAQQQDDVPAARSGKGLSSSHVGRSTSSDIKQQLASGQARIAQGQARMAQLGSAFGRLATSSDAVPSRELLREHFDRLDEDKSGELDAQEVMQACQAVGHPVSPGDIERVMLIMDENNSGFVDFEEFASYFHGASGPKKSGTVERVDSSDWQGTETTSGDSSCNIFCGRKSEQEGTQAKRIRRVEPESVFVVEDEGGFQSTSRQALADLMTSIQQTYEADFHRLEEALTMKEESKMEAHMWETTAASSFDESDMCARLGWNGEHLHAAEITIKKILRDISEDAEDQMQMSQYVNPALRSFLKEELAFKPIHEQSGSRGTSGRITCWDEPDKPLVESIKKAAKAFVLSHQRDLNGIIDSEALTLDSAVQVAVNSLTEEARIRQLKINTLDTPRRIRVSGLQDESAAANGSYCADGLRASWNRPVYVKQGGYAGDNSSSYYLFYDRQHDPDAEPGTQKWTDGLWVIGPTLNSNRCTAVLPEKDGQDLMTPIKSMERAPYWEAYDIVRKQWVHNARELCPRFNVEGVPGETVQDYIAATVKEQSALQKRIIDRVQNVKFVEKLRAKLSKQSRKKSVGGGISRKSFMMWMRRFHNREIIQLQNAITYNILHDSETTLNLPADHDAADNQLLVSTIVQKFVVACAQKQKLRDTAKRRFLLRMNRPALTKAFFSWKLVSLSKRGYGDISSSMFTEPVLPWNVRHPSSGFTSGWESVQAMLLIYVAYTITYRLAFNLTLSTAWYVWELLVDTYFIIDVVLNFHTAFYDECGDLRGVRDGPDGHQEADLAVMYRNYAQGWMTIDIVSVAPTIAELVVPFLSSDNAGDDDVQSSKSKALKVIRLIRLAKLLRLARALKLFKKYEEQLGPSLNLLIIFGIVSILLHTVCCFWFVVGTYPSTAIGMSGSSTIASTRSVGWLQFVFRFDHCSCYDNATIWKQVRPHDEYDPRYSNIYGNPGHDLRQLNGTYYDAYSGRCVSPNDLLPPVPKCSRDAQLPSVMQYYVKSMFTVFRHPEIHDNYRMSLMEMLYAMLATVIMGSLWGVVAGTFSSIFSANQLASQAYRMRVKQLKEFCRIKDLPHHIREKLEAHYVHLYPDKLIIDEQEVIDDLPPQLREELVASLYGRQLYSVPLFLNLETQILTELCLALVPLPALKGVIIAREGHIGTHMFCVSSGQLKVTEKMKDGDDVRRVRVWIEDVFSHANREVEELATIARHQLIDRLMAILKKISKTKAQGNKLSAGEKKMARDVNSMHMSMMSGFDVHGSQRNSATASSAIVDIDRPSAYADADLQFSDSSDDDDDNLEAQHRRQLDLAVISVTLRDILLDDEVTDLMREHGLKVQTLLKDAKKQWRLSWKGELFVTKANPEGPAIIINAETAVQEVRPSEELCGVLRSGELLLDLVKLLSFRAANDSRAKATNDTRQNIVNFHALLKDPEGHFRISPDIIFDVNDLLDFDKGSAFVQQERQTRVIDTLLEIGFVAANMHNYMGPKLHDLSLGVLGPGEFFGELSLLPIEGGWQHQRTAMVVQNAMLHTLAKTDVERISGRFPELHDRMLDHAEELRKVQIANAAATGVEKLSKHQAKVSASKTRGATLAEQDPLAVVKAQLNQQEAKLDRLHMHSQQQDLKLAEMSTQLAQILTVLQSS